MQVRSLLIFVVAAVVLLSPDANAETVRIRGAALALERLSSVRELLARWSPDIEIDWTGYGSASAISALLEGHADLAILSRELEDAERELLARLSFDLREDVLALDGLSIIVHPSNPIESLTVSQLRSIFAGSVVGWHGVGGANLDIHLVMPHRFSDDSRTLERRLFGSAGASERHSPASEIRDTAAAIVDSVASEPRALGVVSMVVDRTTVKTVPLRVEDGKAAVLPTLESVGGGDYPLGRSLFLYYQRNTGDDALRRTVSRLLLSDAQREIARAGFVALPADRPVLRTLQSNAAPARLSVSTVSFPFGSSRLNRNARRVLDGVSEMAVGAGADVWVTGHSEPEEEPANERGLSAERAATVASYLQELGVGVSKAEGRGTAEPMAPDTPDRRHENRRADVWILPRR